MRDDVDIKCIIAFFDVGYGVNKKILLNVFYVGGDVNIKFTKAIISKGQRSFLKCIIACISDEQ